MQKAIQFKNREWDVAAIVHFPQDFDDVKEYAAIVCVHPGSSVKEQLCNKTLLNLTAQASS
jgi:hypothetical protein